MKSFKPEDLNNDDIEIMFNLELCFNPKTKKWDGSEITNDIKHFIIDGQLQIPLGEVESLTITNSDLKTLHNFPSKVKGNLNISNNKLTSLEHCPTEIEGCLKCDVNNITTLKDLHVTLVVKSFSCCYNKLTDLEGCPGVTDKLVVNNNPLTTLKGSPDPIHEIEYVLSARKTLLKNYNHIKTRNFTVISLYKISDIEKEFVVNNTHRLAYNDTVKTLDINQKYKQGSTEEEYYMSLANYMSSNEDIDRVDEIWWSPEVIPQIKSLFKSLKTVNKYNL